MFMVSHFLPDCLLPFQVYIRPLSVADAEYVRPEAGLAYIILYYTKKTKQGLTNFDESIFINTMYIFFVTRQSEEG